jgi:hypothetical protein
MCYFLRLEIRDPLRGAAFFGIRHQAFVLVLICLLAVAVRIAYRAYAGSDDFWQNGYSFFYDIPVNIVAGKGVGMDGGSWAMRPPIYPGFLALAALAGGITC